MAYIKTTWEDGENKYSITDQAGNVILGLENIKILYIGTGGTPLSSEKMNNIEDGLAGVIAESYQTNAEQNIQLWELEAQVIQDKESMSGWQGEGFFTSGDTINTMSNIAVTKGVMKKDGYARFGKLNFDTSIPIGIGSVPPSVNQVVNSITYTPDGMYMAMALNSTPFIALFKCYRDSWVKLPDPSTLPTGQANGVSFSSDGVYLAVAHNGSPYVTIYKRSGDTFTKLTNPSTLPTNSGYGAFFSADGIYLTITHASSPFVTFYKRSGDTFTKLTNPSNIPSANCYGVSGSSDGIYVYVLTSSSVLYTYKRSGDVYSFISTTASGYAGYSISSTTDGVYIAVGGESTNTTAPYLFVHKRTGDSIQTLSISQPASPVLGVSFSADGVYLSASCGGGNGYIYKRSGDTFTPVSTSISQTKCSAFSPNGLYLVIGKNVSGGAVVISASKLSLTPTTGYITLNTLTLPEVSNSVFILDDKTLSNGVTASYDISLDGGTTWQLDVPTADVVTLNHSGNELVVRLNFVRSVAGVGTGVVYWLACWAGGGVNAR